MGALAFKGPFMRGCGSWQISVREPSWAFPGDLTFSACLHLFFELRLPTYRSVGWTSLCGSLCLMLLRYHSGLVPLRQLVPACHHQHLISKVHASVGNVLSSRLFPRCGRPHQTKPQKDDLMGVVSRD